MPMLDQSVIEQIRQQSDIVQVIGQYLPLVQRGNAIKAICPFHDDHDPSMHISQKKQLYKCFVCGAAGNVFGFVERFEQLSFIQAVRRVAQLSNIPFDYEISSEKVVVNTNQRLHDLLNEAVNFQQYQLLLSDNKTYLEYLQQRQVTKELIEQFRIGYQPGGGSLVKLLMHKGYTLDEMIATNIINPEQHELFGRRITFPIMDEGGRVIGFTARTLDPDQPKYINSPTSLLYHKSQIVYNYHLAKAHCQQNHQVLVVEGVMDVIALAKAGIYHSVATLGTACTIEQLKKIRQLSANIILCYDGDSAGQTATFRLGKLAIEAGIPVQVINNTTGYDPDELLTTQGKQGLLKVLEKPMTWLEFALQYALKHVDLDNYSQREKLLGVMLPLIKLETNAGLKSYIQQKLEQVLGLKLPSQINQDAAPKSRPAKRYNGLQIAQLEIINQMILAKQAIMDYQQHLGALPTMAMNRLAMAIIRADQANLEMSYAALFSYVEASDLQELLSTVEEFQLKHPVYDPQLMQDNINRIKANIYDQRIKEIDRLLKQTSNEESVATLMNERIECIKSRDRLIRIKEEV